MTEPRPYRELREVLPPELEAWLHGGEVTTHNYLFHTKPKQLWHLHRHRIMREHIERKPGTRPRLWWRWEARQMRLRLGGTGDTLPKVFPAVEQGYECGIPKYWYCPEDVPRFPNNLLHEPVGTPVSEDDPPLFESEPEYLERVNLWAAGEKACVRRADWRPVCVRIRGDRVVLYRARVR